MIRAADAYRALPQPARTMKLAVIVDGGRIAKWQADAMLAAGVEHIDLLLDCTNGKPASRQIAHAAYYALNLLAIRNPLSRMLAFEETEISIGERISFASLDEGGWQSLPEWVLDALASHAPQAIVKFGMGLLRVPPRERLAAPILSFHHGDPRRFRGRPAGFWEYLAGGKRLGQVVQALTNRLDAGRVLAYGETKLYRHSYHTAMIEAYRHSALLLGPALCRATSGEELAIEGSGRNFTLPGNFTVTRFCLRMAGAWCARILRAVFMRMRWEIVVTPRPPGSPDSWTGDSFETDCAAIPPPEGSLFLADPFWSADGEAIYAESLDRRSGKGTLVLLDMNGRVLAKSVRCGHMSYPQALTMPEGEFLCPEIVAWSTPRLFRREGEALAEAGVLDIAGEPRLLDPTMVEQGGTWFLFGNSKQLGRDALLLFTASAPRGPWAPHPSSPVHVSPRGARMGGSVMRAGDALWRWGQDNSAGYGSGLILYRIGRLDPENYAESEAGSISLKGYSGPHTVNTTSERIVFDRYREYFSPLAWLDRVKARLG